MSERSVAQKLLIREGQRVAIVEAPAGGTALGALPAGVTIEPAVGAATDVAVVLVRDRAALEAA